MRMSEEDEESVDSEDESTTRDSKRDLWNQKRRNIRKHYPKEHQSWSMAGE